MPKHEGVAKKIKLASDINKHVMYHSTSVVICDRYSTTAIQPSHGGDGKYFPKTHGKPNNLMIFVSKKTKVPKQNRQNLLRIPMPLK
jgi:hypothetical protein